MQAQALDHQSSFAHSLSIDSIILDRQPSFDTAVSMSMFSREPLATLSNAAVSLSPHPMQSRISLRLGGALARQHSLEWPPNGMTIPSSSASPGDTIVKQGSFNPYNFINESDSSVWEAAPSSNTIGAADIVGNTSASRVNEQDTGDDKKRTTDARGEDDASVITTSSNSKKARTNDE